jgi:demethylmenaquinone methyltransferase/2-methoxy-6-polyprenyl-1,4-benzoquinol methylase
LSQKGISAGAGRAYEWAHRTFPRSLDCRPIFAREAVLKAGFHILEYALMMNLGLPIEIVVARKGVLSC